MRTISLFLLPLATTMATSEAARLKAMVYRGPAACQGCPESVAALLRSSPSNFDVVFAGPNEKLDITESSLGDIDLYAQPGGGDLSPGYKHMKKYKPTIRNYISQGGHYAGFCLGAYLAGHDPGFDLLPADCDTDEEITQKGAQVTTTKDTIIQVDWSFQTGPLKGEKRDGRWLYFQDGAVVDLGSKRGEDVLVLGRYSSNGDVAACVSRFGGGWVGLVGPHPEADGSWYREYNLTNPDGIRFDIGHDFVEAIMAQRSCL